MSLRCMSFSFNFVLNAVKLFRKKSSLTISFLKCSNRKWNIVGDKKFRRNSQTIDHMLIHCPFTSTLWHLLFQAFNISITLPAHIEDLIKECMNISLSNNKNMYYGQTYLALFFRNTWLERNDRTFLEASQSKTQLWDDIKTCIFFVVL